MYAIKLQIENVVSKLILACALNCLICNTQLAGKCDTGGCKPGFVLNADFTTCQGLFWMLTSLNFKFKNSFIV